MQIDRSPTLRAAKYFEDITEEIAGLPIAVTAIADIGGTFADPDSETIRLKINELLAAMRVSGVLTT